MPYPKRLIEVDLPIKRISSHARREKSIRHGHISTLHIWWARRPLAACRAVLCASLWPDPADPLCPKEFIEFAQNEMIKWSDNDHLPLLSKESIEHFIKVNHNKKLVENKEFLRTLLLDFIADFSDWDNSLKSEFLSTSRELTQNAHIALGGIEGTNPMIADPFAGGGSIPLEAARIGCESFASDINEVPIFINKLMLEELTKADYKTIELYKKWTEELNGRVKKKIGGFYSDNKENIFSFFWTRKVVCEAPNCGRLIPMIGNPHLSLKEGVKASIAVVYQTDSKHPVFKLVDKNDKTVKSFTKGGAALCSCGIITPVTSVRKQLTEQAGGVDDCFLIAVGFLDSQKKKHYRLAESKDFDRVTKANEYFKSIENNNYSGTDISVIPKEKLWGKAKMNVGLYGIESWDRAFLKRQLVLLTTYQNELKELKNSEGKKIPNVIYHLIAITINKLVDYSTSLCRWVHKGEFIAATIGGEKKLPLMWDFPESVCFNEGPGSFGNLSDWVTRVIEHFVKSKFNVGHSTFSDAKTQYLPDDSLQAIVTDPPYYDAIWYCDLSDLFTVWLKRSLHILYETTNYDELKIKNAEIIKSTFSNKDGLENKDDAFYESGMFEAFKAMRVSLAPNGVATIVFAHKSTAGWETILNALVKAGFIVTSSWPIDTEREARMTSIGQSALASSIHLVCRPNEDANGNLVTNQIGDWRDVQQELPKRIHEWMPRLAAEGVAGADAIFACLGPALEIFSRYSSVEKPNGDVVTLREYLEKVWAAVSQEALNMVFTGGEAQGLEEDARLTAMWLWTLTAGASDNTGSDEEEQSDDEESSSSGKLTGGFTLEYDTARKIAQGLGANLEDLKSLVEVKGDKARLLPVIERTSKLFGSEGFQQQPVKRKKKVQLSLSFENVEPESESKFEMPELKVEQTGKTVLDRLHQAMLLFSTGRTEALKRFLVENGAGKDDRFWKLAQSLTSLYPKDTDERRWVEAVQTYKKSLGF